MSYDDFIKVFGSNHVENYLTEKYEKKMENLAKFLMEDLDEDLADKFITWANNKLNKE